MSNVPPAHYLALVGALLSAWPINIWAFSPPSFRGDLVVRSAQSSSSMPTTTTTTTTSLHGGVGVAETYSWKEEQFEIEVKLNVPPGTSARDIKFKCSSESIDLRLLKECDDDGSNNEEEIVLLDGSRNMRGKICVDGTFWSIEGGGSGGGADKKDRQLTVSIEKHFVPISTRGGTETYDTLTDFDWGGIYPNDEEEVSHRKYDEPEELNVREYAAKLGVDIDNLDMSKVDKTMFGAGLGGGAATAARNDNAGDGRENDGCDDPSSSKNKGFHFNIEQATLDQLTNAGLAKEVVQQGDGTEYELGSDGTLDEDRKFSMLGTEISDDELREAGVVEGNDVVPTLWEQQTVPVEEAPGYTEAYDAGNSLSSDGIIEHEIIENEIPSGNNKQLADNSAMTGEVVDNNLDNARAEIMDELDLPREKSKGSADGDSSSGNKPTDPIDLLTVARLKEILRAQGLKVSGTKQILRDRLRGHVNQLLQEE